MKKPVDFDWYCKTKKDVINNAAYELIVALTAKSAPPRKFELSIPPRDDAMVADVVEGAINAVEARIGYYCHPFYQEADKLPCYLGDLCNNPHCIFKNDPDYRKAPPSVMDMTEEKGGVNTVSNDKRYFTVKDVSDAAVKLANADSRFEQYSKICALDYAIICSGCEDGTLYRAEFDVVGDVSYGGSEGIYGDIYLYGNWRKDRCETCGNRVRVYVLKTLSTDRESYLAIGMLTNLICYYANKFISEHMDHFD